MKRFYQQLWCTVASILCVSQLFAQREFLKPRGSGLQAYHPIKKWRGLDLQSYLRGIGFYWGSANTATGTDALISNTSGSYNTADGYYALLSNTTGSDNTAAGYAAMIYNRTGSYKTAIGAYAMVLGGNDNYSVAVGYYSLYNSNSTYGSNTATGSYALYSNTTGYQNTANGAYASYMNTTGVSNESDGYFAGYYATGSGNTNIGAFANEVAVNGSFNTALGYATETGWDGDVVNNSMALGYEANVGFSNQIAIGNSSITSIGGYVNWTNLSDGRYKKNIQQNVPGLAFINKLTPVTYTLDVDGIEAKLQQNRKPVGGQNTISPPGSLNDPIMVQARKEKSAITYTGFVAQDVEKAADSVGFNFSGVDKPKDVSQGFYGLRYGDFVVPLVKAVQELSASSNSKDSAINVLQSKFDSLQTQVNELRALVMSKNSAAMSGASLDQNSPNPFTGSTTIGYSLPKGTNSAQLQITEVNGNVLAIVPLSGSAGKGTVTASLSDRAAGTYMYSLIVNGKLISTRQMIAVR